MPNSVEFDSIGIVGQKFLPSAMVKYSAKQATMANPYIYIFDATLTSARTNDPDAPTVFQSPALKNPDVLAAPAATNDDRGYVLALTAKDVDDLSKIMRKISVERVPRDNQIRESQIVEQHTILPVQSVLAQSQSANLAVDAAILGISMISLVLGLVLSSRVSGIAFLHPVVAVFVFIAGVTFLIMGVMVKRAAQA